MKCFFIVATRPELILKKSGGSGAYCLIFPILHYFSGSWCELVGGKKAKAMKGMKRRAMRKKKAAAPEEAPMKAMRRK